MVFIYNRLNLNMMQITTRSPEQTSALGEIIGRLVKPGTVIAMTGELGSGKTAFVRGLARGLDIPPEYAVTSPTYTLIHEYPGRCPLFHIDLYRLENNADFEDIGLYDSFRADAVAVIEWADRLYRGELKDYLAIHLEISDDGIRSITLHPKGHSEENLLNEVEKKIKEQQWL